MTTATTETTIADDARALRDLKVRKAEAKAAFKKIEEAHAIAEAQFKERLKTEGMDSLKVDGVNFVPTTTIYGQIQDRSAFVEWALEHDAELVQYKEREELINQLARKHVDDGEPLPPGLGVRPREYISQRGSS